MLHFKKVSCLIIETLALRLSRSPSPISMKSTNRGKDAQTNLSFAKSIFVREEEEIKEAGDPLKFVVQNMKEAEAENKF